MPVVVVLRLLRHHPCNQSEIGQALELELVMALVLELQLQLQLPALRQWRQHPVAAAAGNVGKPVARRWACRLHHGTRRSLICAPGWRSWRTKCLKCSLCCSLLPKTRRPQLHETHTHPRV